MSVAKILTGGMGSVGASASNMRMAIEYASSPVAQPATQMRTSASAPRPCKMPGITVRASAANTSGSRKNWVTPMSRSAKSRSISPGVSRSRAA